MNVCRSSYELVDLMDSKGNIWYGEGKVMQGINKTAIGMNISKRLTTGC
jgi:hypothetical protein